jgi:hypothetical protein
MSAGISPLEPPPLTEAISDLIELVESLPEAQEAGSDLWTAVFIAKESLRAAMRSDASEGISDA